VEICGKFKENPENLSRKKLRTVKPDYLMAFLTYTSNNLVEYDKALKAG
jgi:hypothetical protein